MAFKMVNRKIGNLPCSGNRLGGDRANRNPANQAWPTSCRNSVDITHRQTGRGKRVTNHLINHFQMRSCGNFGNNAAMFGMGFDL